MTYAGPCRTESTTALNHREALCSLRSAQARPHTLASVSIADCSPRTRILPPLIGLPQSITLQLPTIQPILNAVAPRRHLQQPPFGPLTPACSRLFMNQPWPSIFSFFGSKRPFKGNLYYICTSLVDFACIALIASFVHRLFYPPFL
jgi:hypothetical protein